MISVVLIASEDLPGLAAQMAMLVPAAVDGLVKEVVLVAEDSLGGAPGVVALAEDSGARLVTASGDVAARLAAGVAAARRLARAGREASGGRRRRGGGADRAGRADPSASAAPARRPGAPARLAGGRRGREGGGAGAKGETAWLLSARALRTTAAQATGMGFWGQSKRAS